MSGGGGGSHYTGHAKKIKNSVIGDEADQRNQPLARAKGITGLAAVAAVAALAAVAVLAVVLLGGNGAPSCPHGPSRPGSQGRQRLRRPLRATGRAVHRAPPRAVLRTPRRRRQAFRPHIGDVASGTLFFRQEAASYPAPVDDRYYGTVDQALSGSATGYVLRKKLDYVGTVEFCRDAAG